MEGQLWHVTGGLDTGGILVRAGKSTTSEQLAERLSTGAVVKALDVEGNRLQYARLTGAGPATGWVSTKLRQSRLLLPMWEVVGDSESGGILVRRRRAAASALRRERLSFGGIVRELTVDGASMRCDLFLGFGPKSGWIDFSYEGRPLLTPATTLPSFADDHLTEGSRRPDASAPGHSDSSSPERLRCSVLPHAMGVAKESDYVLDDPGATNVLCEINDAELFLSPLTVSTPADLESKDAPPLADLLAALDALDVDRADDAGCTSGPAWSACKEPLEFARCVNRYKHDEANDKSGLIAAAQESNFATRLECDEPADSPVATDDEDEDEEVIDIDDSGLSTGADESLPWNGPTQYDPAGFIAGSVCERREETIMDASLSDDLTLQSQAESSPAMKQLSILRDIGVIDECMRLGVPLDYSQEVDTLVSRLRTVLAWKDLTVHDLRQQCHAHGLTLDASLTEPSEADERKKLVDKLMGALWQDTWEVTGIPASRLGNMDIVVSLMNEALRLQLLNSAQLSFQLQAMCQKLCILNCFDFSLHDSQLRNLLRDTIVWEHLPLEELRREMFYTRSSKTPYIGLSRQRLQQLLFEDTYSRHRDAQGQFKLVQSTTGQLLACRAGALVSTDLADDDCMWKLLCKDGKCSLAHAVHEKVLSAERTLLQNGNIWISAEEHNSCYYIRDVMGYLSSDGRLGGEPGVYIVVDGPQKLPSQLLLELRSRGYSVVQNVISLGSLPRLKEILYQKGHDHPLALTPIVPRAIAHPVVGYLLREYLGVDFYLAHPPEVTMKPTGFDIWHTDYPYHGGQASFSGRPQGVQLNIAVDEFREDNAATQYLPGSHFSGTHVPAEWNSHKHLRGGRPGKGVHRDVQHMLAPAGSGIIYDARTWHRRCPECNTTGGDRVAILNSVIARHHQPMYDKRADARLYESSRIPDQLTRREKDVVKRLCCLEIDRGRHVHRQTGIHPMSLRGIKPWSW